MLILELTKSKALLYCFNCLQVWLGTLVVLIAVTKSFVISASLLFFCCRLFTFHRSMRFEFENTFQKITEHVDIIIGTH